MPGRFTAAPRSVWRSGRRRGSGRPTFDMFCFIGSMPTALHDGRDQVRRPGRLAPRRPMPSALVLPITCPPLMPPPASTTAHDAGQWSRPVCPLIFGVRPNSPWQTTSVRVEQAAVLEVGQQRRERGVERTAELLHAVEVVLVRVPAVERDFDERHAALDQPPREQTALAEQVAAVGVADLGLLVLEVGTRRRPPGASAGRPGRWRPATLSATGASCPPRNPSPAREQVEALRLRRGAHARGRCQVRHLQLVGAVPGSAVARRPRRAATNRGPRNPPPSVPAPAPARC